MRSRGALILLIVIVVTLSIASGRLDSATSDEPAYIGAGMIKLAEGRLDYFRDEPPLWNSVTATPIVLAGHRIKEWTLESDHWGVGREFLWRSGVDGHRMLFVARLPTIALFAALIVVMYWFVRRQTGSEGWALAGAVLVGLCPNVMAHGRLATVDLAVSFFTFAATALFIVAIETFSTRAAIGMGICSACAVMSKTSANIIGPYFLLVLILALITSTNRRRLLTSFAIAIVSAIAFAEIFILLEARTINPLVPFREYVANIRAIHVWYKGGEGVLLQYLLGHFSSNGFVLFYPVAILLKTTIPALVLVLIACAAGVRTSSFAFITLLLFVVMFLGIAAAGELDLGIRYVLPIYPFLYAATAIALSTVNVRRFAIVATVLLAWHAVENVAAYPSYISYFNELIGPKRRADRYLVDSNLDWGQDLRRLDAWCAKNGVRDITVHYFGGADVWYDMKSARAVILRGPGYVRLPKGYFAVSRHLYRISFAGVYPMDYGAYLYINHARYLRTVGGSINVYAIE